MEGDFEIPESGVDRVLVKLDGMAAAVTDKLRSQKLIRAILGIGYEGLCLAIDEVIALLHSVKDRADMVLDGLCDTQVMSRVFDAIGRYFTRR